MALYAAASPSVLDGRACGHVEKGKERKMRTETMMKRGGAMSRPDITRELTEALRKYLNPHNDTRVYMAREVTFDYATGHCIRVDYMKFEPISNTVSGIERGRFYCYEVKSSVEDFRSKNGHNFIGDYNYYVMVLAGCPRGGIVLDPFFGSGTTGVVALQEEREFIGIELNPAYSAMAEGRIDALTARGIQMKL